MVQRWKLLKYDFKAWGFFFVPESSDIYDLVINETYVSRLLLHFSSWQIYPFDATFDTKELIPEEVAKGKRYKQFSGYSIQEVVDQIQADFGTIDYMVHSLANGPEVTKPLLETSRAG